ncbi:MAG: hypothetical protein ACOX7X_08685 [Methanosarcina flavescens]|uniref:hypothetical protein n=1 Tax=Methanosarcina flavescens TaxID=1715806 RepID=UPI000A75D836|nr:hypothetical protein [Methanosarcina flavescens]
MLLFLCTQEKPRRGAWTKKVNNVNGEIKQEKDTECWGKGRIEISEIKKREKIYLLLVGIFLAAILIYTLYVGQLLWGIIIDVLILRLYFLLKWERSYFTECYLDEEETGTLHDPRMRRKVRLANIAITLFALGLVIYSYFTFQFIWGVAAGLLALLYMHMLLFSEKNL